jgi:outer membrane protein assembly factor BamB
MATMLSRRGWACLLSAALVGSLLPWSAASRTRKVSLEAEKADRAASSADWPLFRGTPLQTGLATTTLPDTLEIRWTFQAKEGIEGAAAIVGDTVYVGALDEHLYALKLADGSLKWKYKGGPFKAAPSVHSGAVYIGDEDGLFHCVDAKTGVKRWTFDTGSEISSGSNFSGDNVLFGSGDEHLHCLAKDGKEIWKFKVPGGPVLASPAVVGDRTFVSGCDSTLHVIDVRNGKELAAVNIDGQTGSSSAVVGDRLYVGTMNNQFLAIDWKKPAIAWTFEAARRQQPFFASAAVTDDLVVVGSRDKMVHALNRKDGKEAWSFATQGKVDSSPVIAGKRVYAGSLDGHLYVLDLAKGTQIQKLKLGKGIAASPAIGRNSLVIGTREGTLYCLGKK